MDALVVGGTDPTSVPLVDELLAAGHEVSIFHTGRHAATFTGPVRAPHR